MSASYVFLGVAYLVVIGSWVLTLLAGRWLLTGRAPSFMWPTRSIAYASAVTSTGATLMVIQLTRIDTTTYGGPRVSDWMVGTVYVAITAAVGVTYALDRLGRAREFVES